jgi:hypothetical protein
MFELLVTPRLANLIPAFACQPSDNFPCDHSPRIRMKSARASRPFASRPSISAPPSNKASSSSIVACVSIPHGLRGLTSPCSAVGDAPSAATPCWAVASSIDGGPITPSFSRGRPSSLKRGVALGHRAGRTDSWKRRLAVVGHSDLTNLVERLEHGLRSQTCPKARAQHLISARAAAASATCSRRRRGPPSRALPPPSASAAQGRPAPPRGASTPAARARSLPRRAPPRASGSSHPPGRSR